MPLSPPEVDYIGEGPTDIEIARKLIVAAGGTPGIPLLHRARRGKDDLDRRIAGFAAGRAQSRQPLLVLRDLDREPCAGALARRLLPSDCGPTLLRICVRQSESWLLADRDAYARFLGVRSSRLPREPERVDDPKRFILDLARSHDAVRAYRRHQAARRIGQPDWAFLATMNIDYVVDHWDPIRATTSGRAPSLERAITRLRQRLDDLD